MKNTVVEPIEELQLHSLGMKQISPDDPAAQSGKAKADSTSGERSYIATTSAFGQTEVAVQGMISDEGKHVALLNLASGGFTFDQLFSSFSSNATSLFIFDDVSVTLEQNPGDEAANVIDFIGTLRMDNGFLTTFASFLKLDKGLVVRTTLEVGSQDLSAKIIPSAFTLISAAQFNLTLVEGVALSAAAFKVKVEKQSNEATKQVTWSFTPTVTGTLTFSNLGRLPVEMTAEITYSDGALRLNAAISTVTGLFGLDALTLQNLRAEFTAGSENSLSLFASYSAGFSNFEFAGKITPTSVAMVAAASDFGLDDLNDLFRSLASAKLTLPAYNVAFDKVVIGLASQDTTLDTIELKKGLSLGCSLTVHDHICAAQALFAPDGFAFEGSLGKTAIGPVTLNQAKLRMQFYSAASSKPSEFALLGSATIQGLTVDCKVAYEKLGASWNCILYGALNANSFGMSTIFPQAAGSFIDTLKFSKVAIIYASAASTTEDPDLSLPVKKGLQLTGLLQEVPALSQLTKNKQIGLQLTALLGSTTSISISMPDSSLSLGSSVTCDPFSIAIQLLPAPGFDLLYGMNVRVPKQDTPLHFDLKLGIGVTGANGSGTMKGYWKNPFGVNGLQIGPDLALQVDIIYAQFVSTGTPSGFGITGGIMLGDIQGRMAIQISEDPTHEILYGEVDHLSPDNLVKFASSITGLKLKNDAVPDFFDLKQLKLYCAPTGGSIGTVTYEQGFSFACDLVLFGKEVAVYTAFNSSGVTAKGYLDQLEVGPLKIKGENGQNAQLELALNTDKQAILIDGAIDFLGSHVGLFVDVSKQGVAFKFDQNFVGLLKYTLTGASKGSLASPASLDFLLNSEFDNALTDYLRTTVTQKIQDAAKVSDSSISAVQKDLTEKEKAYKALYDPALADLTKKQAEADAFLKQCQQNLEAEIQKVDAAIKAAQSKVDSAKQSYNTAFSSAQKAVDDAKAKYDNAMRTAQEAVNQAQSRYNTAFNNAQNAVNAAKARYDSASASAINRLNDCQNQVNSLQRQINDTQYEIDHLGFWDSGKAVYLGPKLGGLYVAKETANGVLQAAKATVSGFTSGSEYIALTGANRVLEGVKTGGDYAAFQTAQRTLQAVQTGAEYAAFQTAQRTLSGIQYGTQYAAWQSAEQALTLAQMSSRGTLMMAQSTLNNVGSSAAYLALNLARQTVEVVKNGTAAVAYEQAKAYLQAAKLGAGALLNLSAYIASHSGDLVDVKHVSLSASLKDIQKGKLFKSSVDIAVLGKTYNWSLDFNVQDSKAFIENLFQKALEEAKKNLVPSLATVAAPSPNPTPVSAPAPVPTPTPDVSPASAPPQDTPRSGSRRPVIDIITRNGGGNGSRGL